MSPFVLDFAALASIVTVLAVVAFVAIVGWSISPRQKARFDTAAQLPFALPDEAVAKGADHQSNTGPGR